MEELEAFEINPGNYSLKELYELEKEAKKKSLFEKYQELIRKAPPDEIDEAVKHQFNKFLEEKNGLFHQKGDPNDYYLWITLFHGEFVGFKGSEFSFNERISKTKELLLNRYIDHPALYKAELLTGQKDDVIVRKIAHYQAYLEVQNEFFSKNATLSVKSQKQKNTKTKLQKILDGIEPVEFNELYLQLFTTPDHKYAVTDLIEKLFDGNGKWLGHKGKKQEVAALIDALIDLGFIIKTSIYAANIFCLKYNIDISDRSKRTKGFAYNDAYDHFKKLFLKHFKNSSLISNNYR